MPPMKQSKKKKSANHPKKSSSSCNKEDGLLLGVSKMKTASSFTTNNAFLHFVKANKTNVYIWGCLPIVLYFIWSSAASNIGTSTKHNIHSNKSPLERVLDKVVEVGRKTSFYDKDFSFEIVEDRTVLAKKAIAKGSLILDITRDSQIWHTDALLDPFIRDHLFSAKHSASGQLVDHKAYLAVYLALQHDSSSHTKKNSSSSSLGQYFDYLPKEEDYDELSHPVLHTPEYLAHTFGEHSMAYNLIRRRQLEWESEYDAFAERSSEFATRVPRLRDYLVARIHVASRSFTTRTVPTESDLGGTTSSADLELYLHALGYDYSKDGFVVMVPILDALNHHPQQYNVDYRYNPDSRSFSLFAARDIPPGAELLVNYGSKVDPWLYANYGFVNVDGSGRAGASLAAFHTIQNEAVVVVASSQADNKDEGEQQRQQQQQRMEVLSYLQYDDGFHHCLGNDNDDEKEILEFKQIKMSYIMETIVNDPLKWMVSLPPRREQRQELFQKNNQSKKILPSYPSRILKTLDQEDGMMGILSTCRLLALIPQDYQGRAKDVLPGLLQRHRSTGDKKFRMIPGGPSLEYRARAWLKRLAMNKLEQYKTCPTTSSSAAEEEAKILLLASGAVLQQEDPTTEDKKEAQSSSSRHFRSQQELLESHVRLGELQTLELLIQYANDYLDANRENGEEFYIRDKPCPTGPIST